MTREELDQILALRSVTEDAKRGHVFEQALRELLPWDIRPPLAVVATGEQLDAFYEWNSWHFLVEAKAKRDPITRGSHDWEDFELKVRKRKGSCIGLFASLYPVSETLIQAADELNRDGFPTVVLAGSLWEQLQATWIPIDLLLHYLVLHAKAQYKATPPDIDLVKRWCYDRDQLSHKVQSVCRAMSAPFLRRYAHPRHSQIYVSRGIDDALRNLSSGLRPLSLTEDRRTKRRKHTTTDAQTIEYETDRDTPHQICVLRDFSGSGKTTLATQLALTTDPFFSVVRAASDLDIDGTLISLRQLGNDYGLQQLVELNKPLVCVIDSLDEATNIAGKRNEIIGLIRSVEELNRSAQQYKLMVFPLLLVFTIREDYWLQWQSVFEGMPVHHVRNHFSVFNGEEFGSAMARYSLAYQYLVLGEPNDDARRALAVPFNMGVFSEANEYGESVSFVNLFGERVLQLWFERKKDNITRRRVPGLTGEAFVRLSADLAMNALRAKSRKVTREAITNVIGRSFSALSGVADEVVLALTSERILLRDPDNPVRFQFGHSRPMEYLIAQYIVRSFEEGRGTVEELTGEVFEAGVVSMFRVHDYVTYITEHEHPQVLNSVLEAYARSDAFMSGKLARMRVDISHGATPARDDLLLIQRSIRTASTRVSWDAFFTLAAHSSHSEHQWIWEAFDAAWQANSNNPQRWQLLDRLARSGLLLQARVIEQLLESTYEREWEYILGFILRSDELRETWRQDFRDSEKRIAAALDLRAGPSWFHVHRLWNILLSMGQYVLGDVG